jgi:hypothetical protein
MHVHRCHLAWGFALVLSSLACHPSIPSAPTPVRASRPIAPSTPIESPQPLPDCDLHVASRAGIQCINEHGEPIHTINDLPVDDGFFLDEEHIFAWYERAPEAYLIAARTGAVVMNHSLLPPLPPECRPDQVWPHVRIILPLPRATTPDQICFDIANAAYEELEDVRFSGRFHVPSFSVSWELVWFSGSCPFGGLPDTGSMCPRRVPDASLIAANPDHPYFIEAGAMMKRVEGKPPSRVWGPFRAHTPRNSATSGLDVLSSGFDSFEPLATTANGRYVVLAGNHTKGDVLHLEVLLFDRQTGEILPLPAKPSTSWPAPLTIEALRELAPGVAETFTVLFEVSARFIPNSDQFAIDNLLFDPRVGAVRMPGRLIVAQ